MFGHLHSQVTHYAVSCLKWLVCIRVSIHPSFWHTQFITKQRISLLPTGGTYLFFQPPFSSLATSPWSLTYSYFSIDRNRPPESPPRSSESNPVSWIPYLLSRFTSCSVEGQVPVGCVSKWWWRAEPCQLQSAFNHSLGSNFPYSSHLSCIGIPTVLWDSLFFSL